MTTLKNIVFGCVSDHGSEANIKLTRAPLDKPPHLQRVKFGLPLEEAFKDNVLPIQLLDMLVYIARDGVTTTDLFRRPGNPNDLKQIVKRLSDGRDIDYANYNFYTLASVIKKFLLKIPGGVFGPEAENELLNVLDIKEPIQQFDAINKIIRSLPKVSQDLSSMLFGTWFRMSHHSEFNSMSSESVAKSVAGSLFHTCADDPHMVNLASNILKILIENFAASIVFGKDNIEFFAQATRTQINVLEKYKYEFDANLINIFGDMNDKETNGILAVKKNNIPSVEECLVLFEKVVAHDAKFRGIDPTMNGIELQCYLLCLSLLLCVLVYQELTQLCENGIHHHKEMPCCAKFNNRISMVSSLPTPHLPKASGANTSSPQSYQPISKERQSQECTSLSSYLSAPDVYEGMDQFNVPGNEILTKSLSRVESVYRRQMLRLRQRNNWFLNYMPTSTNARFFKAPDNPFACPINDKVSGACQYMSSSFSCGILSSNTMPNNLNVESALNDHKGSHQSNKISSSSTTFDSSVCIPPIFTTTNMSSLNSGIPVHHEEPKPPECNSIIPDLSISYVESIERSSQVLLTSSAMDTQGLNPSCNANNFVQNTKYFHIRHHYGINGLEAENIDFNSKC